MGSTGSSTFGDYKETGKDKCGKTVRCSLEEIENCPYFKKHGKVPKVDTPVSLDSELHEGRLMVVDDVSELGIGLLPTEYNYLHLCVTSQHYSYEGDVFASRNTPAPEISVELNPMKE